MLLARRERLLRNKFFENQVGREFQIRDGIYIWFDVGDVIKFVKICSFVYV